MDDTIFLLLQDDSKFKGRSRLDGGKKVTPDTLPPAACPPGSSPPPTLLPQACMPWHLPYVLVSALLLASALPPHHTCSPHHYLPSGSGTTLVQGKEYVLLMAQTQPSSSCGSGSSSLGSWAQQELPPLHQLLLGWAGARGQGAGVVEERWETAATCFP